jgi:diacylglycerol kinase family enzyme
MGRFETLMGIVKNTKGLEHDLIESTKFNHVYELIPALDFSLYDALLSFGGDGTHFQVIDAMMGRKDGKRIPIGCIGGGTANDFVHSMGYKDTEESAKGAMKGMVGRLDQMRVLLDAESIYDIPVAEHAQRVHYPNLGLGSGLVP